MPWCSQSCLGQLDRAARTAGGRGHGAQTNVSSAWVPGAVLNWGMLAWAAQAIDVLTPMGRGQSLLVVGAPDSGKSYLALDAILGQRDTGVRCVYAATAHR